MANELDPRFPRKELDAGRLTHFSRISQPEIRPASKSSSAAKRILAAVNEPREEGMNATTATACLQKPR